MIMQRFIFLTLVVLVCTTAPVWAQPETDVPDDERIDTTIVNRQENEMRERKNPLKVENLFIGMTASLLFGNVIFVEGSPYVGYLLGDHIGVGIGGTYIYTAFFNGTQYVGDNVYGGRLFVNLRPLPKVRALQGVYLHAEGEYLNHSEWDAALGRVVRRFVPAVNLGIGHNTSFDKGFGVTTELLINALWFEQINSNQRPVYTSPWQYRIGIYYAF